MQAVADDNAGEDGAGASLRTCIVTRAERPTADLIRFAAGPDGTVVPDLGCRLPGRGAWVCADWASVAAAVKRKAFSRSMKKDVSVPADLADQVERLMLRRVCDALSIARKAGLVATGFTKIDAAITAGEPMALLHGSDASEDGVQKLDRRFAAMCRDAGRTPIVVRDFTIEQMSLALGRANVVHAALMVGGAARSFLSEAERLARYRSGRPEAAHDAPATDRSPPTTD
jgi:predicted RNA-binding protein YlxR (DUF448 family)